MSRKPQSLVSKLIAACNTVGVLEKKGHNGKYPYQRASDIFQALRGELFKRGVIILPNETECSESQVATNGGGSLTTVRLKTEYILTDGINPELRVGGYSIGSDTEDKAVYKAKTGGLKALLREIAMIADREDDPEFLETRDAPPAKKEPIVRTFESKAFNEACIANHKLEESGVYLQQLAGVTSIFLLPRKQFKAALKWARSKPDSGGPTPGPKLAEREAAQPTRPPERTMDQARDFLREKLVDGGYLTATSEPKKPQPVVAIMDAEPEKDWKLRG